MSDYLPNDMMMEILARLPVRTLLQIICVCKSWCSLITSDDFVTFYHNRTTHSNNTNNTHLLLIRNFSERKDQELFSLYLDNESLTVTDYHLNLQIRGIAHSYRNVTVLGCCNGLVCLIDYTLTCADYTLTCADLIYLWNPSIRKFVVLPEPRITFSSHVSFHCALGFGFDSITNDYQVVRIAYVSGDPELDIYSLKEGCWRRISVSGTIPCIPIASSHAFLNGTIHWISGEADPYPFIVSFNLGSKVFSRLELPRSLHYTWVALLSLGVFQDSLFVFYNDYWGGKASIWVMKQYGVVESWINLFGLCFGGGVVVKIIGLKRNGEVLFTEDEEMMSVDTKTLKVKYLGMRGFGVNTCTESLVLIDKVNGGFGQRAYTSLLQAPRMELEEPRKL